MKSTPSPTNNSQITLVTNCWEKDWKRMLCTDHLSANFQPLTKEGVSCRVLLINNVQNREKVERLARQKVEQGVLDAFYFSEDYADQALQALQIEREFLVRQAHDGFWYSIACLVGIYLCRTPYLLYFMGDAGLPYGQDTSWVTASIQQMEQDKRCIVANPVWNDCYKEAAQEADFQQGDFYYSKGFSDQCFLIPVEAYRQNIYGYIHPVTEQRYPVYGGNCFERRVGAYLHSTDYWRLTYAKATYIHKDVTRFSYLKQKLEDIRHRFSSKG